MVLEEDTIILLEGDGLTDSLKGLSSTEVHNVVGWRDFYFKSCRVEDSLNSFNSGG
ncbi:hypothetical protein CCACVL1_30876 [Corchorus capsularis]|uniref:Uncharacterized protein n=1 Tax=Corchorus capsularis TaxID=210143 RepID=A0A1R3FUW4_COCAP|nr:hypothetical protein CCACVL1_30876 [Corchorus capsularis]